MHDSPCGAVQCCTSVVLLAHLLVVCLRAEGLVPVRCEAGPPSPLWGGGGSAAHGGGGLGATEGYHVAMAPCLGLRVERQGAPCGTAGGGGRGRAGRERQGAARGGGRGAE